MIYAMILRYEPFTIGSFAKIRDLLCAIFAFSRLCVEISLQKIHRRGAENAESAQRSMALGPEYVGIQGWQLRVGNNIDGPD